MLDYRDTLIVSLSDMHSGGTTALFPNYKMSFRQGKEGNAINHDPNESQLKMFEHWIKCADEVKRLAIGKKLVIVHNGDATEGFHHGTVQVISSNPKHQSEIHIELMDIFLERCGFSVKNGDELHYTSGTESHTEWNEYGVKEHYSHLNAQYHDEMQRNINGRLFWWTHHGANAGKGTNEGNGYRNWLRDIYWDCIKGEVTPPDFIITSHFHKSLYQTYVQSYDHTLHGMVLPSWQMKTRYAFRVAPFQRNDIGLSIVEVSAQSDIRVHRPLLMQTYKEYLAA